MQESIAKLCTFIETSYHQKEDLLVFNHIPKTAGTTFKPALRKYFTRQEILPIPWTGYWHSMEKIFALTEEEKSKIRFIEGHQPFGIHEISNRRVFNILFLRDPIERALSHYYYFSLDKYFSIREVYTKPNVTRAGFPVVWYMQNFQTRWLSNMFFGNYSPMQSAYNRSKSIIEKSNIGIVEGYDESIKYFEWALGYELDVSETKNVTKRKKSKKDIDPDDLVLIKKNNILDINLYKVGLKQFYKQIEFMKST